MEVCQHLLWMEYSLHLSYESLCALVAKAFTMTNLLMVVVIVVNKLH